MPNSNLGTQEQRTIYQVQRERSAGQGDAIRKPTLEEHACLDRARLSPLNHALDGPTATGNMFTGVVSVMRRTYVGERMVANELVDVIDQRVAFRNLYELELPRASELEVAVQQLRAETDQLARMGFYNHPARQFVASISSPGSR